MLQLVKLKLSPHKMKSSTFLAALVVTSAFALQGCTVLAVADVVGSVAIGTVGLAADAAIGTVKLGGKAVSAVAGAVIPGGSSDEKK